MTHLHLPDHPRMADSCAIRAAIRAVLSSLILSCGLLASAAWAACSVSTSPRYLNTRDPAIAQIPVGVVNIGDNYLQPPGTLLASMVVPPTAFTYTGASADSTLWTCDAADASSIYFLVGTNGDEIRSGFWDGGIEIGMPDVYGTYFHYVGMRAVMDGVVVSRFYRRVEVRSYATVGNRIHIRLRDVPPLLVELYKLQSLGPTTGTNNVCGAGGSPQPSPGRNYGCRQPNVYIQLKGPGIASDTEGADSRTSFNFWGGHNGFPYGIWNSATLVQVPSCRANVVTPVVRFPSITAAELAAGGKREAPFTVQLECSTNAISGVTSGATIMGLQTSVGAYRAALDLGLVNASNGVTTLLSDEYGVDPELAKGVGVTVRNAALGSAVNFVGQAFAPMAAQRVANPGAGWYPALEGASSGTPTQPGYASYSRNFIATFGSVPGQQITAGKYHATAYVRVRVQ